MEPQSMNLIRLKGKTDEPLLAQILPNSFVGYDISMDKKPRRLLAENLRRLMDANNMSTHAMKRASGLPQTTIARILREEVAVTLDTLMPLAKALRLEPWMLLVPDLDPAFPPKILAGDPLHSISPERLKRFLVLFDSLTDKQQDRTLIDLNDLAETNLSVVRELVTRPAMLQQPKAQYTAPLGSQKKKRVR